MNRLRTANILRNTARYSLLLIASLFFIFSLLSGAESFGGGLKGIIRNSPNAVPWLVLLILLRVAWRWELTGGIVMTASGLFLVYFFNFQGSVFYLPVLVITLIIPLSGSFFIISWYLSRSGIS